MKRLLITSTATILVVGAIGAVANLSQPAVTGADSSPIIQTLANHEARITNLENKMSDQENGTTTPSVPVPAVTAPSAGDSDVINASTIPANATPVTPPDADNSIDITTGTDGQASNGVLGITWQEVSPN